MPDPQSRPKRIRRLLALAKPQWPMLVVGTCFLGIGSATTLAFPQAIRVILDEALGKGDLQTIDYAAMAMAIIFLIQGGASALRYFLFTLAGERIVMKIRHDLYSHIIEQEIGFFDARRTGELLSRLSSDTGVLQNTVSVNISMVVRNVAGALGGVILLAYTSPILTGIMLTVVPVVALGAAFFGRRVRGFSREVQDAVASAGEVAEEVIAGVRTVRLFVQEEREKARYGEALLRALALARRRIRYVAIFTGSMSFAGYGSVAVVLWYGGRLVVGGELSIGDLTSFILYTLIVAFSLGALGGLYGDFMRSLGAADRVFDLLDRVPEISPSGGRRLASLEGGIVFEDVNFSYPTRPDVQVLRGIELEVSAGDIVALVGPSGGGKSTIVALIPRFYDPQQGAVRVGGTDVRELDPNWLRSHIGTVQQSPTLFSTTIESNIRYGKPKATDEEVRAAARAANAHDFISEFPEGYQTRVGERGVQLSGGQRQRVAIARAILKDPKILVLDEATSSLDAQSEHLVKEALDRLMQGRTTLIIAHRLSTVRNAGRVVVVDRGRIVQSGSHQALMDEGGLYHDLVQRQLS